MLWMLGPDECVELNSLGSLKMQPVTSLSSFEARA